MMWTASLLQGRGAFGVVAAQGLAVLPPLAVVLWNGGADTLILLAAALTIVIAWDAAFAVLRGRRVEPFGLTTAMIVVVFAPGEVPLWHLAVALSLGCVIGERVFGGRGFAFLSPAVVALALLLLSLPDLALRPATPALALASLPGALLLLVMGLLSLRVVVAFFAGIAALTTIADPTALPALLDLATFATASTAALVFLISDPTSGAVTPSGRIAYGALAALLGWVFTGGGSSAPSGESLVFAALTASLFAPLLDHLFIAVTGLAWGRRNG